MKMTKKELAKYIDHSLLKPQLTREEIIEGCKFAAENECVSICINPQNIPLAKELLAGSNTLIGTVIGFPSGAHTTLSKVMEAKDAYSNGARELDMVIDIGALKSGEYDKVREDIKSVVDATPAVVKVILEMHYLTQEEKEIGCKLCEEAGAHYVKTSTGFAATGATLDDIRLMRNAVSEKVKVKAAGGIGNLNDALELIEAGCTRLGTSKTKMIFKEINAGE